MLEGNRSKLWGQRLAPLSGASFLAHHRPVDSEPLQVLPGIMLEKLQKTHSGDLRGHLLTSVGHRKPSRVPEMPSAFISCLTGTMAFSGETGGWRCLQCRHALPFCWVLAFPPWRTNSTRWGPQNRSKGNKLPRFVWHFRFRYSVFLCLFHFAWFYSFAYLFFRCESHSSGIHYVAQDDLELLTPKCWDYKYVPHTWLFMLDFL